MTERDGHRGFIDLLTPSARTLDEILDHVSLTETQALHALFKLFLFFRRHREKGH